MLERNVIDGYLKFQKAFRENPTPPFKAEVLELLTRAIDLLERYLDQTPPPPGAEEWRSVLNAWNRLLRHIARHAKSY